MDGGRAPRPVFLRNGDVRQSFRVVLARSFVAVGRSPRLPIVARRYGDFQAFIERTAYACVALRRHVVRELAPLREILTGGKAAAESA